jgi:anti-anti-sigma factor
MAEKEPPVCSTRQRDEIGIVELHANLNAHFVPEFEECLDSHLKAGRTRIVLVCLGCDYICSDGLGVLASLLYARKDLRISMANPGRKFREVLDLVQLSEYIQSFGNEDEAVEAIRAS